VGELVRKGVWFITLLFIFYSFFFFDNFC
jgi:hypothetical protein